ncbi:MAG: HAMP domain-containing protein [Ardenticatenaceae bacterium]|nr:HAMP domain-containing protein [Ardenticatenaceae bacterium]
MRIHPQETTWINRASWRILIIGIVFALSISALLMVIWMRAPFAEVTELVYTLASTSLVSLGVSYLVYRRGWARFPSLNLTLVMTYVLAALVTLVNVWVMSQRMFVSEHDLLLSAVLLLFAGMIATTFGIFVASTVTDELRQLAATAQTLADGDLGARVQVKGRDEIARLAQSFNMMAAQLQATERKREELEQMRRNFIAWTSHDLRTPLTSIRAMVEALHDGVVDDPATARRYYATMRNDVIGLNNLINDLFELSQLDAGGLHIETAPHSLRDLISDALESFQALAQQRHIQLDGEVEAEIDPVVMSASKIGRVVNNLIGNALRYTPAGGQVFVRAVRTETAVQVTVQDNGPGFREKDLPHLFEQFYRGEEARSRQTGGAGLGLAIARGIIMAHNGRIWAENIPTGGALVGFELPI